MRSNMNIQFLGNSIRDWLFALLIAVVINILLLSIRSLYKHRKELAENKGGRIHFRQISSILFACLNPVAVAVLSIYIGTQLLELPNKAIRVINSIALFAAAFQIGIWASEILKTFIQQRVSYEIEKDSAKATATETLGTIGQMIIWAVIILVVVDNIPGVDITALIASLGISSIVVAFALQNLLEDLFASLIISLDQPFAIGDFIDLGNHKGTVEKVGLKSTTLKASTSERIIIGNSDLLKSRIRNYGTFKERFGTLSFYIHPRTPIHQLCQIPQMIQVAVNNIEPAEVINIYFKDIENYAFVFELAFKCVNASYKEFLQTKQEILYKVIETFNKENIVIAFPLQKFVAEVQDNDNRGC